MLATESLGSISFLFLGHLWRGVNKLAVVVQTEEVLTVDEKAVWAKCNIKGEKTHELGKRS